MDLQEDPMPIPTVRGLIAGGALLTAVATTASVPAAAAPASHGCTGTIKPASIMTVQPCDDFGRILNKAANVVPRPGQLAWQQRPVTAFTHFGMNTFTDREWGSGAEPESRFDPPVVDTDQWMRSLKAAGVTQVMLTAKHHDGFVLYPTRYTDHSVVASPWWAGGANPRGDVLRDYVESARREGLKVGVYLSPADGAELPKAFFASEVQRIAGKVEAGQPLSIEEQATWDDRDSEPQGQGRYGSGSAITERTIPTLVPGDDRATALKHGQLPKFTVHEDDYNTYYLNQLYELFTQYGPIDELWLDGANPWAGTGVSEPYDFTTWFRLIRSLSPDTVVFAGPQGTRWVGNESGVARTGEWSVVPATADPATAHNEGLIPGGAQAEDIGSRTVLTGPDVRYLQWFPAEADSSIRPGWFYHPDESPQSPATLVTKYQQSVGRNAVMLLNVPPGTDGRIADADLAALTSFGTAIRDTYGSNLLTAPRALADDDLHTSWSPPGGADTGTLTLTLPHPTTFDQLALGEDITRGQHVERFSVDVWDGTRWDAAGAGTTIGHERLLVLPSPVTTTRIRVHIDAARATPHLATVGLYRTAG